MAWYLRAIGLALLSAALAAVAIAAAQIMPNQVGYIIVRVAALTGGGSLLVAVLIFFRAPRSPNNPL